MSQKRNILLLLLLCGILPLYAARPEPHQFAEDPCCPAPDPCAKCAQIWPTRGPDWIITPGAGPCVARGLDVYLTVDFIYWTAREDHLAFAYRQTVDAGGSVTSRGDVYHPDWNFRPGFKVGLGFMYDHDGWDAGANYTYFRGRNTKRTVISDDVDVKVIRPINDSLAELEAVEEASCEWDLDFNVIDVELGRNFFISRYLKLRPHFGLKGTWQKQDYVVLSQGGAIPSLGEDQNKLDYWGIGIRAGCNTQWHLNRCVSILGNIAISGLWERFDIDRILRTAPIDPLAASPQTIQDLENKIDTIKPVLELFLGARWETWFCCDRYHFSADAGWEIQWWSDQNQFFTPTIESKLGDLNFQGLTLHFRLDF